MKEKITGWIARDENTSLYLFLEKPKNIKLINVGTVKMK